MFSGWLCFFNSSWGRFEARFSCILESLSRHADLIDREANAFLIAETMQWRQEALKDAAKKDKERLVAQLNSVLAWLRIDSAPYCSQEYQEDALDRLSDDCYAGTTEWILQNHKVRTWLKPGYAQPILWIKGKPGSGMSVNMSTSEVWMPTYYARQKHSLCKAYTVSSKRRAFNSSLLLLHLSLERTTYSPIHFHICDYAFSDITAVPEPINVRLHRVRC
jgi:hypothetical protein